MANERTSLLQPRAGASRKRWKVAALVAGAIASAFVYLSSTPLRSIALFEQSKPGFAILNPGPPTECVFPFSYYGGESPRQRSLLGCERELT